jgi:hypothetical protein
VAIQRLLRSRATAIAHHDRRGLLATLDPESPGFRRSQLQMLANLARVRFAGWAYQFGPRPLRLHPADLHRYAAPTWAPAYFVLRYRLAGFDARPTLRRQYPTFVERHGRWYLGSLSDFAGIGRVSATDLWDYAPVREVRRTDVLVLGPPSELSTMALVADVAAASIPKVTSVWGPHWPRRAVILVPSSQREMAQITSDRGNLDQIAALTSAEVNVAYGRPSPVGDRITINPRNWPKLGPLGADVVITHELTHVATRADTGAQTPKWLSEGFAEYVGFKTARVPTSLAAADLARQVRAGRLPARLPPDRAFRGSARNLGLAYQSAWLACRFIAQRYGERTLVTFYRAVGRSRHDASVAVSDGLRQELHLTTSQFTRAWQAYLRVVLG